MSEKTKIWLSSPHMGGKEQEFVNEAFQCANMDSADFLCQDEALLRPTKTSTLIGDASKAKAAFGFNPKYRMPELVKAMYESDLAGEQKKES